MRTTSSSPSPPLPQARFPAAVSGGPLAVLIALLIGAAGLLAVAVVGHGAWPDWRLPGALVLVAGAGHVLLWLGVVEPVRRFGEAMTRLATDDHAELVPRARIAELDRVAVALYRFRRIRPGRRAAKVRRRLPLAVTPCLAAVLVLGWAAPAAVVTVTGAAVQADAVVRQAGAGAVARADELESALRGGLAALQRAADPPTGAVVADPGGTARQVLAEESLFRSVAVVEPSGQPIATAGSPLSSTDTAPPPQPRVVQVNHAGSEPSVLASAPMWNGSSTLVAEFDPRALNDVIRADNVHTRVVGTQHTLVLANSGYTAFTPLEDPALRALVRTASANAPAVERLEDDRVVAAQRVSEPGVATDLGWVLVEDQGVVAAAFASDANRRAAIVVIAVSASLAIAALAWTVVTTVVPARRLARHVERLAAGEAVSPLAPQRLDEIGTAVAATNRFAAARGVIDS